MNAVLSSPGRNANAMGWLSDATRCSATPSTTLLVVPGGVPGAVPADVPGGLGVVPGLAVGPLEVGAATVGPVDEAVESDDVVERRLDDGLSSSPPFEPHAARTARATSSASAPRRRNLTG